MKRLFLLIAFVSCTSTPFTKTYKIAKGDRCTLHELRLSDDNSYGRVVLRYRELSNTFYVRNISKDNSKLMLRKEGEKFKAWLESDVVNGSPINLRSILNGQTLWKCNITNA